MDDNFIIQNIIKDENIANNEPADEAFNLLQNGILVETSKGLVCMSLNDAISSDLNLSVEDLKNVATKLILQQNIPKSREKVYLKTSNLNFDSDGFSSECSDISLASASSNLITFTSISGDPAPTFKVESNTKCVQLLPCAMNQPNIQKTDNFITESSCNNSSVSDSDTSTSVSVKANEVFVKEEKTEANKITQNSTNSMSVDLHKLPKRRGGWPKGRKRKPELLNLPPKAPATGYNLFLNEQRKLFKDSKLVFHEITKLIGNKWSNLSLEEKRPYLARAEEDKRRYREELKQYRQSDAYRAYLAKKRKNRLQNNVLSESDMDATDEIDDEDNEELYCRTCDQWFHNLHNKREHLQGRQHTQSVAGEITRELDIYNNSKASSQNVLLQDKNAGGSLVKLGSTETTNESNSTSVAESMASLVRAITRREEEVSALKQKLQETSSTHSALSLQLNTLKQHYVNLKNNLSNLKEIERDMEAKVSHLWQVPSWFIITDLNTEPMELNNENGTE